jgi:hypothetical protein
LKLSPKSLAAVLLLVSTASALADGPSDIGPAPVAKPAIRFDDANFAIDRIPDGWRRRIFSKADPASAVECYTVDGKVRFEVIAEVPNPHPTWTTDRLRQSTQAILADKTTEYTLVEKTPLPIHGLAGILSATKTRAGNQTTVTVSWVFNSPTGSYQLIATGDTADEERVRAEARKIDAGFRLLDPHFVPRPVAAVRPPNKSYRSDRYGYSVSGIDPAWAILDQQLREKNFACADFAAFSRDQYLIVLAVPLHGLTPEPHDLATAMLARINLPIARATSSKPIESKGAPGLAFEFVNQASTATFHYKIRVVESHGMGYLIWAIAAEPDAVAGLDKVIDQVKLDAAGPKSTDPVRDEAEKSADALVANEIGNLLFARQRPRDAVPFHRLAVDDGLLPVFLLNLVGDFSATKEPGEALAATTTPPCCCSRPRSRRSRVIPTSRSACSRSCFRASTRTRRRWSATSRCYAGSRRSTMRRRWSRTTGPTQTAVTW